MLPPVARSDRNPSTLARKQEKDSNLRFGFLKYIYLNAFSDQFVKYIMKDCPSF